MSIEESIKEKIEYLPPLPETVLEIQRICNDPNSSAQDLVSVVERDPLLTANLLRVANSPYYGFTSKINSVEHAIALFGMTTVLGFALSSAVRKNFNELNLSPYGLSTDEFANSAFKQNKLMINWHFSIKLPKSDNLVPASFVNEIGKVVLAQVILEKGLEKDFYEALKKSSSYFDVEKEFLGITTPEVTAKILYRWRLNVNIVYSILSSIEPEKSEEPLRTFGYAIKIVRECVGPKGIITQESIKKSLPMVEKAGLSKKAFLLSIKRTFQDN